MDENVDVICKWEIDNRPIYLILVWIYSISLFFLTVSFFLTFIFIYKNEHEAELKKIYNQ
jgi:hypothetical protein